MGYGYVKLTHADVMTGFNGTLFCYGQTGSGKTYSASALLSLDAADKQR